MKHRMPYRILTLLLCAVLLFFGNALPAFANSAQTWFEGVDASGAIMPSTESPIVVEHETLTFDIGIFPEPYYYSDGEYEAYTARVSAAYTFYNPSDYTVTARLLFPFGTLPYYMDNNRGIMDDTEAYDITLGGETVAKTVRHTLSGDAFSLAQDLSLITDGFAEDDFYAPDLTVTKYTFAVEGEDAGARAACVAFDLPRGEADYRIFFPEQSGMHRQKDGDMRLSVGARKSGYTFEVYVIGTPLSAMPKWTLYRDGGVEDGEELRGTASLVSTETTTLLSLALSYRDEQSAVSETDWYNAVLAALKQGQAGTPDYPLVRCEALGADFEHSLMRWYEYEITLAPRERVLNTVTAPIYPAIDLRHEPSVYEYTYLLSPARTWTQFGSLEIVINTPYFVTKSSLDTFEKTDNGYSLTLDGLPESELTFTLSTAASPKKLTDPYQVFFIVMIVIAVLVIAAAMGLVMLAILLVYKLIKKRVLK